MKLLQKGLRVTDLILGPGQVDSGTIVEEIGNALRESNSLAKITLSKGGISAI